MSTIYVLAGVNGAGKSSIAGAAFGTWFDPDEAAGAIRRANPGLGVAEANGMAWREGRRLLERAIHERLDFAFETTLGGRTIPRLLRQAIDAGIEVAVWYAGLATPDLHIARVRARVARGGHDIPEDKIRERYDTSRLNLIDLLPRLAELVVYDNSEEADPHEGESPEPVLLLHMKAGKIGTTCDLGDVPAWAKPILAEAFRVGV